MSHSADMDRALAVRVWMAWIAIFGLFLVQIGVLMEVAEMKKQRGPTSRASKQ